MHVASARCNAPFGRVCCLVAINPDIRENDALLRKSAMATVVIPDSSDQDEVDVDQSATLPNESFIFTIEHLFARGDILQR